MTDIIVKEGEAKTLTFTITQSGEDLDVSGGDFRFAVKQTKDDAAYQINKTTSDFDDTNAGDGILTLPVTFDIDPGEYVAELMINLTDSSAGGDGNIDKSLDLSLEVLKAVITD